IQAVAADGRIALRTTTAGQNLSLAITSASFEAANSLGLSQGLASSSQGIAGSTTYTGLTIDNPDDVDWYKMSLLNTPADGRIAIRSASIADELKLNLYKLEDDGTLTLVRTNDLAPTTTTLDLSEALIAAVVAPAQG